MILLLICITVPAPGPLAQVDSSVLIEEMQRLNRVSDSLNQLQLDSSSRAEGRQKEFNETPTRELSQQEKREAARKRTLKLALSALFIIFLVAAIAVNRGKRNKKKAP